MKKVCLAVLPALTIVLELLPFGAVCIFATSPTERVKETFSYFSLTPFGYAKDKGYEVAAAVAADGISGVHTEGIMNFLLNEAKRQGIGTILTRDTSRISRGTSSFMRFERKFRENGIRFEYLSKPDNELPVTPMMEAFEAAYKKRRTKNGVSAGSAQPIWVGKKHPI